MDSKQALLEQVVVDYFRQRGDTVAFHDGRSVRRVELRSATAREHFGRDRSAVRVIFDGDLQALNTDGELITATHPWLDIIRNDLRRDERADPRLAEAHVALQLLDRQGQPTIPDLVFTHPQGRQPHLQLGQSTRRPSSSPTA